MSKHHVVKTQLKNKEALVEALKTMGLSPKVYGQNRTMNMYGTQKAQACIVIPREQVGASFSDIGFEQTEDGFIMHVDTYGTFKFNKLKQHYSQARLLSHIKLKSKYQLKSNITQSNGKIKMKVRVR